MEYFFQEEYRYCVSFYTIFNFKFPKEIMCKITVIPHFLFENENLNFTFARYITNNLSNEELEECVKYNIDNNLLCSFSKIDHINFCKENNLDYALGIAEQICLDMHYKECDKKEALKYISVIKKTQKMDINISTINF